jgi:hypothetical protein
MMWGILTEKHGPVAVSTIIGALLDDLKKNVDLYVADWQRGLRSGDTCAYADLFGENNEDDAAEDHWDLLYGRLTGDLDGGLATIDGEDIPLALIVTPLKWNSDVSSMPADPSVVRQLVMNSPAYIFTTDPALCCHRPSKRDEA